MNDGGSATPHESHPSTRTKTARQALLHYGGSALILILLLRFLPRKEVWAALTALPTTLWLAAIGIYLAGHCIGISKWRLMVNTAGAGLNVTQAARCYLAGLFGSLFLPSLIGGDLLRAALAMRLGRSKAAVLLGSFLDRTIDLIALALLAAVGALLVPRALDERSRRFFLLLAVIGVLVAATSAAVVVLLPVRRFSYRMRRRFARIRAAGYSMARNPHILAGSLSLAIVTQLIFINLSVRLAEACGLTLMFRTWLFAWPLAKLSAALPITQGGLGVREAALAALLLPFGAPAALSVAAGLAWEAIVISGALLAGLFSLLLGRGEKSASP
jgi:glycosyltransferase 2 family protein